jgi:hypothetical protein
VAREELEGFLDRFIKAGLLHSKMGDARSFESFNQKYEEGNYQSDSNPYQNKCSLFCDAWEILFEEAGIPVFKLDSFRHTYLLVPTLTRSGVDILMLDPTIRQVYGQCQKTYFLGSRDEFVRFNEKMTNDGAYLKPYKVSSAEDFYFKHLRLTGTSGWSFPASQLPSAFELYLGKESEEARTIDGSSDIALMVYQRWIAGLQTRNFKGVLATIDLLIEQHKEQQKFREACQEFLSRECGPRPAPVIPPITSL